MLREIRPRPARLPIEIRITKLDPAVHREPELLRDRGDRLDRPFDLQILASIFRRSFAAIQGKCGTTEQEVQSAVRIAAGILRGVGLREQGMTMISAAAELQLRVFTVFTRSYDQARRGVLFLRWDHGDAETIAPSLYAGRERRRFIGSDAPRTENGGGPSPNQAITKPFIA